MEQYSIKQIVRKLQYIELHNIEAIHHEKQTSYKLQSKKITQQWKIYSLKAHCIETIQTTKPHNNATTRQG